jgi:hypothetical protein
LPGAFIQGAYLLQQPDPVTVLEIEQGVERPVQVVGEVSDFLPQFVVGVPA